ncbi:MAG: ZPR1 zinc finger domain-containing protein [Promethearchaeota archaeon]
MNPGSPSPSPSPSPSNHPSTPPTPPTPTPTPSNPPSSTSSSPMNNKTSLDRKDGNYEFPPLEQGITCPICEKEVEITRTMYKLPDGDDIIIFVIQCAACGYKKSDMIPLFTAFQPGVYRLTVDDGDFTHKIFRGATGNIEIPEIGVTIERGPAATFDFTNVEGILLKMEQQVDFFLSTTPQETVEWKNANNAKTRLISCKNAQQPFTLILTDPEGGSYITPSTDSKMVFTPEKPTADKKPSENNEKYS